MIHRRARLALRLVLLPALVAAGAVACATAAPTTADPSASAKTVASASASAPAPVASTPVASASAPPVASADTPPPPAPDPLDTPMIVDEHGNALPQTDDKPSFDSPAWKRRAELLFEAIQKDDPSIAARVFFPKEAYVQVKDIPKPEGDWKARLMKAFARDIHEYHKAMKKPEDAKFVGFKADMKHAKWMPPRGEGNKVGYYRITHTKLQYKNADGKDREMDVTSLISWRGEWFVVHLHGFK